MVGRSFGPGVHAYGGPGLMGMFACLFVGLVVLLALALLVAWYVRRHAVVSTAMPAKVQPEGSAKEVAKLRYARGEITREQYQQMLVDLDQPAP
jgi:uncharacterized membrane protein